MVEMVPKNDITTTQLKDVVPSLSVFEIFLFSVVIGYKMSNVFYKNY